MPISRSDLPSYVDLMYPTLKAVEALGGSAQGKEITARVLDDIGATEAQLSVTYENRPKSVLVDRLEWARSYAKLGGALESPRRGLYVLTPLGKEIIYNLPEEEAQEQLRDMDRTVRATRTRNRQRVAESETPPEDETGEDKSWRDILVDRLHRLSPDGFEEFVLYLLRTFGLELTRVGGSGDEGIDGINSPP
jgi:restriction system protein